jgi:tetratricopeptide (TPR) repeat protein
MRTLPDPAGTNETVAIWNVRETLLDTGRSAALRLDEWQQALDFSREAQQSKKERGVPLLELASTAFNDHRPLCRLNRYAEAIELLRACRDVFERENSIEMLGKVFSALANLEDDLGRSVPAQQFEKTALRYKYAQSDPRGANISHFNLSNYITKGQGELREVLGHRTAAVLIAIATQSGDAAGDLAALARNLRDAGPEGRAALPVDFAALCAGVESVEGVRFREMIERLAGGPAECDEPFSARCLCLSRTSGKTGVRR